MMAYQKLVDYGKKRLIHPTNLTTIVGWIRRVFLRRNPPISHATSNVVPSFFSTGKFFNFT
jgi:hypothetical protein